MALVRYCLPNFYNVDKEFLLERRSLEKRLSSDYINYSKIKNDEDFYKKALDFILRTSYGLFSFITKEKNPVININYKTLSSSCGLNENIITLSVKDLKNEKLSYQERVDSIIGTLYHEFYHKRYTNKDIANITGVNTSLYYSSPIIKEYVETVFKDKLFSSINNILEDRRIERFGAIDFPGYSFYLEESRGRGFTVQENISVTPDYSQAILTFLCINILLPELKEKFDKIFNSAYDLLLKYHRTKQKLTQEYLDEAKENYEKVKKVIEDIRDYIKNNEEKVFNENNFNNLLHTTKEIFELIPEDIRNKINIQFLSIPDFFSVDSNFDGFTDAEISMLEIEASKILKNLENEAAETKKIEKIKGTADGYYEEFEIITQNNTAFNQEIFNTAKKQSKKIFNDLAFLNSKFTQQIEEYELDEGDIDNTEIFSVPYNKNIFESLEHLPKYQLDVCILIDESGSMSSGGKIRKAVEAALSLILALEGNPHINLFVYGHTADISYGKKSIQIYKYYNSLEKLNDYKKIFHCKARGNNADGYAIERVAKEMNTGATEKLMIVISDGQPNASRYSGESAENHVRGVVNNLEKKGVHVIQICIDNIESSPRMFKHYVPYDKDGKFFDKLKSILQKKLIKFANVI